MRFEYVKTLLIQLVLLALAILSFQYDWAANLHLASFLVLAFIMVFIAFIADSEAIALLALARQKRPKAFRFLFQLAVGLRCVLAVAYAAWMWIPVLLFALAQFMLYCKIHLVQQKKEGTQ